MNAILTLLKKVVEKNKKISASLTKIKVFIKQLGKLSNPKNINHLTILVYCKLNKISFKFCFHFVNEIEIKKLIQGLNAKKATGIGTIPPKLIKVAVEFLNPVLTKSINSSIEYKIFPDLAKAALVVPLDKGKPNKNDIAKF